MHWFKSSSHCKEFTVLRDFNLMVFPGETVGVVGRKWNREKSLSSS